MNTAKKLSIRLEAVGGDKVRQEFNKISSDGQQVFNRLTHVMTPVNDNLKVLDNTAKAFSSTLKQATAIAGTYLGLRGLTSMFKNIVNTNTEFESLIGSLNTVTGSAKGAKEAFAMIERFAIDTPYQLEDITESFIRLKALGLDATTESLTAYGNTASAFGKNITDFTDAVSSAVMFNFKSLRTFGIQAQVEGDKVKFTFQGITTTVGKNVKEIEKYLKSIGLINFSGAMAGQMNTMGGTLSNIEDAVSKLIRAIGENGLNKALRGVFKQFNDMLDNGENAAKVIGKTLATAVNVAGKAFFTLANNIELIITLLTVRLGAAAITQTFAILRAAVYALNTALVGTASSSAGAAVGLKMMWQVSKLATIQMTALSLGMKALKGALALIGGPAGLAVITGLALYNLVDSHDVAKRAASDHAETLKKLQDELNATAAASTNFSNVQGKNEEIAKWGLKLKQAVNNIQDLKDELKETGGLSFLTRNAPNMLLKEYEIYASDLAKALKNSRINLTEYEKEIWKLAAEYPDFQPQAQEIKDKLLLLKAAEQDAITARKELSYIENPFLRPSDEGKVKEEFLEIDTIAYEKNIEDIKQKIFELQDPYDQAMQKATEWRNNALANLDSTKEGYEGYKNDIARIYDDMAKKAADTALKSSTEWQDGLARSLQSVYADASDLAKMTESLVKDSFNSMTDALTDFVIHGKSNFGDFVNSILEGMVRIAIQYAVIKPIMSGVMSLFGISIAHTGGVIGEDPLASKEVSPLVFTNAQKFHTGGVIGNEVPIIAQRGEAVFTKGQMKALGTELNSKTPVYVNVNVKNNVTGTEARATATKDSNGNLNLDILLEKIEGALGKNINKGEGLSPILEKRYALNPAYGSYG